MIDCMTGWHKFPARYVLLLACLLTGCALGTGTPTPSHSRKTPDATLPPTLTQPLVTETPDEATPEADPSGASPSPTLAPRSDLEPIFTQELAGAYQGIQINSRLITDLSANDEAAKIALEAPGAGAIMAEFWVKAVYKVWLVSGGPDGTGPGADVNYGLENFWKLWRTAQKSGAQADWEQVQITIYAHDLANPDYVQAPVALWIGYLGGDPPPGGTLAVRQIDLAVVTAGTPNVTPWGVYGAGMGTNYLDDTLYAYVCKFQKSYNRFSDTDISALIGDIPKWWLGNHGQGFASLKANYEYDFISILKRGGFKVTAPKR